MNRFLEDINLNKEPRIRDSFNKVDGMLRAHNIDPETIPWFRAVTEKMKAPRG